MVISGYVLHLPEDESVVLSGPAARRLIDGGNGDAALLYIAVLRSRGCIDNEQLLRQLGWPEDRFRRGLAALAGLGLIMAPAGGSPAPPAAEDPPAARREDRRPEYTRSDMARALEGSEFAGLTGAVEDKLGKKLTTPDLEILLGLYDHLGLPVDVIFSLVGFCMEKIAARYGPGRRPTLRQIEQEGYLWARQGIFDQKSASAHIKKYQRTREAVPQLMALLGLEDRKPSPGEEKYLAAWSEMGFDSDVILRAYDRTVLRCKELRWPYMNKILDSWHRKGLHTLAQVEAGDRPAPERRRDSRRSAGGTVQEDMVQMERFRQQLREQKEGR